MADADHIASSEEQIVVGDEPAPDMGPTSSPAAADEPSDGYEVPPATPKLHSQDETPQQDGGLDPSSASVESEVYAKSNDIYTPEAPAHASEELVAEDSHPEEAHNDAVVPFQESPSQASEAANINLDSQVNRSSVCTGAVDVPSESSAAGDDPPDASTEANNTDIQEDVEVSHIVDTPEETSDPLSEVPTDNPFVALEEEPAFDGIVPQDTLSEEKPPIQERSMDEFPPVSVVKDGKCEESQLGSDISSVKEEEEEPCIEKIDIHSEDATDRGETEVRDEPKRQVEPMVESHVEPVVEDESAKGLQQVFELATEEAPTADANQVSQSDIFVHESHVKEGVPAEESILSSKIEDAVEGNKAECPDGAIIPPEEEDPLTNLSTGKSRSIDVERCSGEGAAPLTATNGENGIPHDRVDQALANEQDMLKGDEGKKNPGFSMKFPLIVTGLAVAVGVAVASMRQPR